VAAALALAAGLLETALIEFKRHLLATPALVSPHVVWMAPAVYAGFFMPAALAFSVPARRWPRAFGLTSLVCWLSFFGAFSALDVLHVQLGHIPIVLLSLGICMQLRRFVAAKPELFQRLSDRGVPVFAVLVLALAGVSAAVRAVSVRRAESSLPPAAPGAPNVLIIILDTVRGLSMSVYGYQRPTTPELERLASQGVVFERAVATAPWTGPSHAGILTGRWANQVSTLRPAVLDPGIPTLTEALRDLGYRTGGFIANARYVGAETGLGRGAARWDDWPVSLSAALATTWLGNAVFHRDSPIARLLGARDYLGRRRAPEISRAFLEWARAERNRPFFAVLNYMDAHDPYLPPEGFARRFAPEEGRSLGDRLKARLFGAPGRGSPEQARRRWLERHQGLYDASVAYLDREMGRLFGALDARGLLGNTLVILTSDHGEEFDEHGVVGHTKSLYWAAVQVPLMLWFQGRAPEGARVRQAVSLRSIPTTVLDLLGAPSRERFPGVSLASFWRDSAAAQDTVLSELQRPGDEPPHAPVARGDMRSAVVGSRHYILNGDGLEEVYDIEADPFERVNLLAGMSPERLGVFRALVRARPEP
jgi:arylsulfatase A-like enzyme